MQLELHLSNYGVSLVRKGERSMPRLQKTIRCVVGFLFLVVILSACEGIPVFVNPTPTPDTSHPPAPSKTIVFCNDESGSYPLSYFQSAARKVADWVGELVQPGQAGSTIYVRYINSDSYSDTAYFTTIDVPSIPYEPGELTPLPTPPPLDPPARGTATAATQATQIAYGNQKTSVETLLSDSQKTVKAKTDQLRKMPHPGTSSSDIWGCFQKATDLFLGTTGPNFLVIASDMEIAGPQQKVKVNLNNASVTVINFKCYDANSCYSRENYWVGALKNDHPGPIHFLDPESTAQKDQLFN